MPLIDRIRLPISIIGRLILSVQIVDVPKFLHLLFLFEFFNFFVVVSEHFVFLVPNASEVKRLQTLIVDVCKFLETILVLSFGHFYGVVGGFNVEVILTWKLNRSLALAVINENKDFLVTEAAKLYSLLQESSLPLAEGHIALVLVLDELELVNFLLSHIYL